MTFLVDCMLGRLAKWLKVLGFDAVYFSRAEDDDLLALARRQGRVLLSRDHALLGRAKGLTSLFIESESWPDQVRQVLARFDLFGDVRPYTRCLECNVPLKTLSKDDAANLIAPFVHERAGAFALCPSCGRVYWPGTHQEAMQDQIDNILKFR
jgi:uncharacterized protein with PIN domain